jgi:hypothetical protein
VVSVIVVVGAILAPALTLIFGNLEKAAAVAQLVSIAVGVLGLWGTRPSTGSGTSGISPPQHYPSQLRSTPSWWMVHGDGVLLVVGVVAILLVCFGALLSLAYFGSK